MLSIGLNDHSSGYSMRNMMGLPTILAMSLKGSAGFWLIGHCLHIMRNY